MKTRLAAAALVITLAACGEAPTKGSTMDDAELLQLGKQLTQCYRDNGATDMPDPYVEDGRLKLPEGTQDKIDDKYPQEQLDQIKEACRPVAAKLPEGALAAGDEDEQQPAGPGDVAALRKFAQCMRENGVPEYPDPKADGTIPLKGTALGNEGPSDRIRTARESCKQYWSGGIAVS